MLLLDRAKLPLRRRYQSNSDASAHKQYRLYGITQPLIPSAEKATSRRRYCCGKQLSTQGSCGAPGLSAICLRPGAASGSDRRKRATIEFLCRTAVDFVECSSWVFTAAEAAAASNDGRCQPRIASLRTRDSAVVNAPHAEPLRPLGSAPWELPASRRQETPHRRRLRRTRQRGPLAGPRCAPGRRGSSSASASGYRWPIPLPTAPAPAHASGCQGNLSRHLGGSIRSPRHHRPQLVAVDARRALGQPRLRTQPQIQSSLETSQGTGRECRSAGESTAI